MEPETRLNVMLELAESVGVSVRRAPAGDSSDHPGGALIRLKGRELLFLDPTASIADQIAVTAAALVGRDQIEEMYLPPEVREAIDTAGES